MKKFCLLLLLMAPGMGVRGQTLASNNDLKFDADYFLMRQEFDKALELYLNVLETEPENADIKSRAGICYLNMDGDKSRAIPYLQEASQQVTAKYKANSFKEIQAPPETFFLLGSAYRVNKQFDEAIAAYTKYKEYLDPKNTAEIEVTNRYIRNCDLAKRMVIRPVQADFLNLGPSINTDRTEFNPVISGDGNTLVFTVTARNGFEVYLTTRENGAWTEPANITPAIGSGRYLKSSGLSYDGNTLLLVEEDPLNSQILISQKKGGRWAKAQPLPKPVNTPFNETHASLSPDGAILFLASDRKGGQGELDLYQVPVLSNGSYGTPVNLGAPVNTPYSEDVPFVSYDGTVLYFSSDGHEGIGGKDIYSFSLVNPGEGIRNLGYPVNTPDNNTFYCPASQGEQAFLSLFRDDSYGGRDIYQVGVRDLGFTEEEMASLELEVTSGEIAQEQTEIPLPVDVSAALPAEIPEQAGAGHPETPIPIALAEPDVDEVVPAVAEPAIVENAVVSAADVLPDERVVPEEAIDHEDQMASDAEQAMAEESVMPAMAYCVQFMALRRPVDILYFNGLKDIILTYSRDKWFRYMTPYVTDRNEAERTRNELAGKGFADAFIRPVYVYPKYTIQWMAVPGPVTDLKRHEEFQEIRVTRGNDGYCRYSTGLFANRTEALAHLSLVREKGYRGAFVSEVKTQ